MESDAPDRDAPERGSDAPGAIPGRPAQTPASTAGAVRQAARPNRGFLWHHPLPTPEADELLERSRGQVARAVQQPTGGSAPSSVPVRDERQAAPSVAPLGDDFDLDAALEELTSRNAEATASRFEAWRRRSATGALLTGIALGLQQVFEPERKDPNIVLETSGQPPRELPIEADLDQLLPRETVIKVRPWLLAGATAVTVPQATKATSLCTSWRLAILAPVGAARVSPRP